VSPRTYRSDTPSGASTQRLRRLYRIDFSASSPAERDATKAARPLERQLAVRFIYAAGKRYAVYDANELVDRLSDINRSGRQP
jgi:hypothetical protein